MSIEDLHFLVRLLQQFLDSDGDLPDSRVEKTLQLVRETLADSDPDGGKSKDF
jgi:hypothetical protein